MTDPYRLHAASPAPAALRLTARQPLVLDVYDALVDMLMNHDFDPGERLNIDALTRTLGVSQTPIREAMARLEAEGLIVKEPRRSYTVAPLITLDELRALMDLRLLIEPSAAAAAARRASPAEGADLIAFARSGGAGRHGGTANRLDMIYDATFHDRVAALGGNSWLRDSLARLRSHVHMYRLYHHARHAAATTPEHVAIAEPIAANDPDAAAEAMRRHLTEAMERIDEVFARNR
ncbi:GntR family transcriptional regulator [Pseudonocardia sp. CA-107938]|uniref:GntR family transcriptional regulator n=1 Tax=Pseudonocardia sp. CA-107938 TaxID=3240021 RepID=UPI003D8C9641